MIWVALRMLVGAVGVVCALVFAQFWFDPVTIAGEQFALDVYQNLGKASLRADLGGFFGMTAVLCLGAAFRNKSTWLTAPLILFSFALAGRLLTLIVDGSGPGMIQPMVVEAVIIGVLALGRFGLGKE